MVKKKPEGLCGEKDLQPCLRLTIKGTRVLILVEASAAIDFFTKRKELPDKFKMKAIYHAIRHITRQALEELAQSTQVYHTTIGPGDMVYIPFGMVLVERVPDADTFGIRLPLACPSYDLLKLAQEFFKAKAIEFPGLEEAWKNAQTLGKACMEEQLIKKENAGGASGGVDKKVDADVAASGAADSGAALGTGADEKTGGEGKDKKAGGEEERIKDLVANGEEDKAAADAEGGGDQPPA